MRSRLRWLLRISIGLLALPVARAADANRQPTFVIVHGAWGGGWAFKEVDRLLTADGNKVYRPTLTGQGERVHLSSPGINLSTHITDIVNVILWEDLHDIVLVGHSYGGMVVAGVMDRVPERIRRVVFVDAAVPNDGESMRDTMGADFMPADHPEDEFLIPKWLKPNPPLPHDVPQPAKTWTEPVSFKNPAAHKLPVTYILTVDAGRPPKNDDFYRCYQRAKSRGWTTEIMEGDHNVQWSKPKELVRRLEAAARK